MDGSDAPTNEDLRPKFELMSKDELIKILDEIRDDLIWADNTNDFFEDVMYMLKVSRD